MRFLRILMLSLAFLPLIEACSLSRSIVLDEVVVTPEPENLTPYQASATRHFDLIHTDLDVAFNWEKQHLMGVAVLSLKPYFYERRELVLDAKGMDLFEIALSKEDGSKTKLDYTYDSLQITIDLGRAISREEEFDIYIAYTAKPNELDRVGSAAIQEDKGLYFINPDGTEDKPQQIWTQGEPEASSCWFPTIDKPNERTTQSIKMRVEDRFATLSNGKLVESVKHEDGTRTDHWLQSLPHAPYLFMMAIGEFGKTQDKWRDIDVDYYLEADYHPHAKAIFGNTPEMLDFYSETFGVDYPWEKYAQVVVRDFVSGAMENTTATIHYARVQADPRELLDGDHEDIIAHELVHQWFGDLVTCESWANISLNESFATYGEYLWEEHKNGKEAADHSLLNNRKAYMQEARQKQVPLVRYFHASPGEVFDRHSYEKGSLILHALRNVLGDEAFFAGLKLYLTDNAYQAAEVDQLRLAFEEVSGQDLHWFFDQWFYEAGHPELDIRYEYNLGDAIVRVTQEHSQSDDLLYRIPMQVRVDYDDRCEIHDIEITERNQEFKLPIYTEIRNISFDPEGLLLCERSENKPLNQWVWQFHNAESVVARLDAQDHLIAEKENPMAAHALRAGLKDPYWYVRLNALDVLELAEGDSLIALVQQMADEDESTEVRATALEVLAELEELSDEMQAQLIRLIEDSSYRVSSTALELLSDMDEDLAMGYAEKMEDSKSDDMLRSIAYVYASAGAQEKQSYFEKQLEEGDGYLKYGILYHYGTYLSKVDRAGIESGLTTIEEIGMDKESHWLKFASVGGLRRMSEGLDDRKKIAVAAMSAAGKNDDGLVDELQSEIELSMEMKVRAAELIEKIETSRQANSQ